MACRAPTDQGNTTVIVLSLLLVIVAAVALVAGMFDPDSLTLVWVAIAACLGSFAALAIAVVQRRRGRPAPASDGPSADASTTAQQPGAPAPAAQDATDPAGSAATVVSRPSTRPVSAPPRKVAVKKVAVRPPVEPVSSSGATPSLRPVVRSRSSAWPAASTGASEDARAVLGRIRGVGPAKQQALLERFGSLQAIRDADVDDLARVRGIGPTLARTIKDALNP